MSPQTLNMDASPVCLLKRPSHGRGKRRWLTRRGDVDRRLIDWLASPDPISSRLQQRIDCTARWAPRRWPFVGHERLWGERRWNRSIRRIVNREMRKSKKRQKSLNDLSRSLTAFDPETFIASRRVKWAGSCRDNTWRGAPEIEKLAADDAMQNVRVAEPMDW